MSQGPDWDMQTASTILFEYSVAVFFNVQLQNMFYLKLNAHKRETLSHILYIFTNVVDSDENTKSVFCF